MADIMTLSTMTLRAIGAGGQLASIKQERTPLARIWGDAEAIKMVAAKPGDPESEMLPIIVGNFRAETHDGSIFASGSLALPEGIAFDLLERVERAGGEKIAFDMLVGAAPSGNPSGYHYVSRTSYGEKVKDPLLERQSFFSGGPLSIEHHK